MVRGVSAAVTRTPLVHQCAETQRIALGAGNRSASSRQALTVFGSSSIVVGDPCPKKATGIKQLSDIAIISFHVARRPAFMSNDRSAVVTKLNRALKRSFDNVLRAIY